MKKMQIRLLIAACLCIPLAPLSSTAYAEDLVTVAWRVKPPHQYTVGGQPRGVLVERVKKVFSLAKIKTQFVEESTNRIFYNFKNGRKNYCAFGLYHAAERESFAQYSSVFHRDPPQTILVSPEASKLVSAHLTLTSLLADPNLTLGVVDTSSYGPELDAMIKAGKNKILRSTTLQANLARMIAANRASFMFVDRKDWDYLKENDEHVRGASQIDLPDLPPSQNRYILCSKDITAAQMQGINKAIQKVYVARSDN
jgi:polar amino acid transport system substrate-binding protein